MRNKEGKIEAGKKAQSEIASLMRAGAELRSISEKRKQPDRWIARLMI